ncbi:MAG: Kae1-associated serine/threonine protein kinase [Theionarchaea archaeon]|nr:Kae1-associated serine/threonine protein kinase [Theionarchaea archaeon]
MNLIRKGAEADLFCALFEEVYFPWNGEKVLIKRRVSKGYRLSELDEELRVRRTLHEARLLHDAKAFVNTPSIYEVDQKNCTIIMEYIEGVRAKEGLTEEIAVQVGETIARLHEGGIIHGDITTSNIIIKAGEVYLIDFGLGEFSEEIEPQAVDLHLLKQTLKSTHHQNWRALWKHILTGYKTREGAEDVISRIKDIEKRGRYVKR